MSARVLQFLGQEFVSTLFWILLFHELHQLSMPETTAMLLALAAGAGLGALLALLGWWIGRPMTISPALELLARVCVWAVASTIVTVAMILANSPAAGMGLFAAVVAAFGAPTVRQIHGMARERRERRDEQHTPCACLNCRRARTAAWPHRPSYSPRAERVPA